MTENLSGRAMASSLDLVALNQLRSELEDSWESVGPRGAHCDQSSASSSRSFFFVSFFVFANIGQGLGIRDKG